MACVHADETARKNYEQYGHPDGPQSIKLNVALPEWLINGDAKSAPLVLGGLVLFGILLPLGVAARYLLVSHKFAGPNQVMAETMEIFLRCAALTASACMHALQWTRSAFACMHACFSMGLSIALVGSI